MPRSKRYTRNLGRPTVEPLPARQTVLWIRYEHESEPYGVFSYTDEARRRLDPHEVEEVAAILRWFDAWLVAPELDAGAIDRFWFRAEAVEHVSRARRLGELVGHAGIPIVERRTRRVPGKIRWQDPHQVCLLTFRDAPRPKR